MSSRWRHALCRACYAEAEPGRTPYRVVDPPEERCCGCGTLTVEPIYYRAEPTAFECGGEHDDD